MSASVYLDANGGVPLSKIAEDALIVGGRHTNPSNNLISRGKDADALYQKSVMGIKRLILLGGKSKSSSDFDINDWCYISNSGASEGNATAIHNIKRGMTNRFLVMKEEHAGVTKAINAYKCDCRFISYDEKELRKRLSQRTDWGGLFITHALSLDGSLVDVPKIVSIFREYSCGKHGSVILDATQSAGKGYFRYGDMGVDVVIFSAHKFGGPKGYGGMIIRKSSQMFTKWHPLIPGSQQKGMRGGTVNVMSAYATFKALAHRIEMGDLEQQMKFTSDLIQKVKSGLVKRNLSQVRILGRNRRGGSDLISGNLGNTLLISVPLCSKGYVKRLSEKGFDTGIGSACQTNDESSEPELIPDGDKVGVMNGIDENRDSDNTVWRYKLRISSEPGMSFDVEKFITAISEVHNDIVSKNLIEIEKDLL